MQHGEARVAIDPGLPYVADGGYDWRANVALEYFGGAIELRRGDVGPLVGVPVGVVADCEQDGVHFIDFALYEVGNEEGLAAADFAAVGVGRQGAGEGCTVCLRSAVSLGEGEEVACGRVFAGRDGGRERLRGGGGGVDCRDSGH